MRVRGMHVTLRTARIVAIVALLAVTGAACSSSSGGGGSPPAGGGSSATLAMKDFAFTPTTLDVHSGATQVTITNNGSVPHSFTLNDGSVDQVVNPGQTVTVTVNLTADVAFHCRFHPTKMTGTVHVS